MEVMESSDDVAIISSDTPKPVNRGTKSTAPQYQKYYKQAYRTSWESLPDFKGWLRGVDGQPSRAFCSYCQVTLFAHRLSLLKHTCTRKHQKASHSIFLQHSSKTGGASNLSENATADAIVKVTDTHTDTHANDVEEMEARTKDTCVQPKTFTSTIGTVHPLQPLQPVKILQAVRYSELQLKPKAQPESGMTVTIIREDGTRDPMHLKVTDYEDDDAAVATDAVHFKVTNYEGDASAVGARDPVHLKVPDYDDASAVIESESGTVARTKGSSDQEKEESTMAPPTSPLTTHVLDTSRGAPVHGIKVSLYRLIEGRWTLVNESITSSDGRCNELIEKPNFVSGRYKLHFDVDRYFELQRQESMYPFVEIVFDVHAPLVHYHIPLLISPYGYTTYRGS